MNHGRAFALLCIAVCCHAVLALSPFEELSRAVRSLSVNTSASVQLQGGVVPGQGWSGGMFYSYYTNGVGWSSLDVNGGWYSTSWSNIGNFVAGVGWKPGGRRSVTYSGRDCPSTPKTYAGKSYVSLYGWTVNPLVEYYIVDDWAGGRPSKVDRLGTVYSDGETYDLYKSMAYNAPSIQGQQTFPQYWSVRQHHRLGGTITTGNHFDAWERVGLHLGSFDYMILATEGVNSSGKCTIQLS